MKQIILASASLRRKELLGKTGIKFKTVESNFNECLDPKLTPHMLVKKLSLEKVKAVYEKFKQSIIIAADTLIVCGDRILGKPKDANDAGKMLEILNGKMHYVITGFTVCDTEINKFIVKSVKSKVYFNKVSEKEISDYITARKPFDKAGAYGIQELPKIFVKKIIGDYDNVVGLPIKLLLKVLKKLGVK